MENLQEMFAKANENKQTAGRGLQRTAELTTLATKISHEILRDILQNDEMRDEIVSSQKSNDVLDNIINDHYEFSDEHELLIDVPIDELEKMLKSQQSKRSRAKSMPMTLENYTNMMTAAVAERLIRTAGNLPKGAYNGVARRSTVGYSEEELIAFMNDQESLGKAIRNIQSKKSIMKSKANFNEESEAWLQLLEVEGQLKELRDDKAVSNNLKSKAAKADEVEDLLKQAGDVNNLSETDSKSLLDRIMQALKTE